MNSICYAFMITANTHYSVTDQRTKYLFERGIRLSSDLQDGVSVASLRQIVAGVERTADTLQDAIDSSLADLQYAFMDLTDVRVILSDQSPQQIEI